ncbi:AAA family ATPase [Butyrivibrio sp. YAB3001]|uniref:AAA family ATPase n=1 Tax=Butyrivibrio sp. YAB3001 TaxID=1520812 RepID=UPI0008F61CE6|nr:AAA family ATPase [Butyrivibrio sp. YAB3001]SFC74996.1 PD-(D/E)XK nuclease superfamily protein [Butyrivibrio sp. YAB3001]
MGMYLDSSDGFTLYEKVQNSKWYVDKTELIPEVFSRIGTSENYICITRPRRFGKTVAANMLSAYFCCEKDAHILFDKCNVSQNIDYENNINKFHVISIDFSKMDDSCDNYEKYISRIKTLLSNDLRKCFPDVEFTDDSNVAEELKQVFEATGEQFVFIFDEWDAVFHMNFITEKDRHRYLLFLKNLLKDQAYVAVAYMTGILPIAKYSSGSELNMFMEYTMVGEEKFSKYFGFCQEEVEKLYLSFLSEEKEPRLSLNDLAQWYDGYHTMSGNRIYNPRSVSVALTNNNLGNYWTSSGPYDEIFYYIRNNIEGVKNDLARMVTGQQVRCEAKEYAATSMNLKTRDEILSAMVVYGFLTYSDGFVMIPNKELLGQFTDMLYKEESLGYVHRLAKESEKILDATIDGNENVIAGILEQFHDTEAPILQYNNESDLSAIVNLAYLAARDRFDVQREDKSGKGFVDFIFYPRKNEKVGIILELKVDSTADEAIKQIKDKKYVSRLQGKVAESSMIEEAILVGISYDKKQKKHDCKIERISI